MLRRVISRRIRPIWVAALASAAWANRDDLRRWLKFIRRSVDQRNSRTFSDFATEFRVRAAVSASPILRRDPALKDLVVHNGVVTVLTTTDVWPDPHNNQIHRLKCVKGISEVTSRSE